LRPGFWLAIADGRVYGYEAACYKGQAGYQVGPCPDGVVATSAATGPVVGITGTPDGKGYWVATANGGVSAFGDAHFYGSLPGLGIHVKNIRDAILSYTGTGYALGGVFIFGTGVKFYGSLPGIHVRVDDIVGIALTPDDKVYWMASANERGVFGLGDAHPYYPGIGTDKAPVAAIAGAATGS
jgi:hypothetical protein